jgi:hypothetical protein
MVLRILFWQCGGLRGRIGCGGFRWFGEVRVVNLDIEFDFFDGEILGAVGARRVGVDLEWKFQAVDFAIVAEERLDRHFLVFRFANAFPLEQQKCGGIEIVGTDVARTSPENSRF